MKYRPILSILRLTSCLALAGALFTPARPALAVPYASQVTSSPTQVSFRLNEDADNVKIVFTNPDSTTDIGPLAKGGPYVYPKLADTFKIVVSKSTGPGYLSGVTNQISDDNNVLMRFVNQRGVVVNRNPASPYFGRIYVSVSAPGTNSASGRAVSDGIYVLDPDQTAPLGTNALTGGLPFGAGESPHRLALGPDGNLYISDWSDPTGTLYVTDPNVATNAAASIVLSGQGGPFPVTASRIHGSISASWTEGSLATGDLVVYVIDEDLQTDKVTTSASQRNSLWRWNIGSGPLPFTGTPERVGSGPLIGTASQLADVVRGADGKWYISQRRSDNATTTGIFVRSADNTTTLWSSLDATRAITNGAPDLMSETAAIDITADGKYLAALKYNSNSISIFPMVDGIPNMTNRIVMPTSPTTANGRDIGFDAAGNLYSVSSGQGLLRIYSPGGTTVATTGSDGTFSVFRPPSVSVTMNDALAAEAGPNVAVFTVKRMGDLSEGLVVNYTLTGTATNGVDYVLDPLAVEIPAGAESADVIISPLDDSEAELTETVTITLTGAPSYDLGLPTFATANIVDNEYPNVIRITALDTNMYERLGLDRSRFVFTRLGDTNLQLEVLYQYDGSAVVGFDYTDAAGGTVIFPPGSVTQTNLLFPINDTELEGDEVLTLRVVSGPDYTPGTPNSASARIQDDELPPGRVLFSDNFNTDTSANWITQFGANNGVSDYTVSFNSDYTARAVPPAPHSDDSSTLGLMLTVNKNDGSGSSAGVNLYPAGQEFGGNYALRFDMFLSFGNTNTTEHALAGLNHSGQVTNRYTQSTDANNTVRGGDGIWMGIVTDASDLIDYGAYTSTNADARPMVITNRAASGFTSLFPNPPYAFAGSPTANGTNRAWADVEISQINNLVSLKVNQNLIFQVTNTYGFNSGKIMLGYNDQFDSIGSVSNFVVFDNVRVVSLDPEITKITQLENNNIQIDFQCALSMNPVDFRLESTASLTAPVVWTEEPIEIGGAPGNVPGSLRATGSKNGSTRFYRVRYIGKY